jgi:hypothetical protein
MGVNTDIVKERVPFNWGQFLAILLSAISATFTVTKIVDRFEAVEKQQKIDREYNKEQFNKIYNYIDEIDDDQTRRLDTKTKRNSEAIDENTDAIEELEENKK